MCPLGHFAQKWENQINHYEENKPGILTSTSNIYTNEILAPWKSMNSIRDSFQTSNGILHSSKVRHCLKMINIAHFEAIDKYLLRGLMRVIQISPHY